MSTIILVAALLVAPDAAPVDGQRGYASAYAPNVFEDVVRHRFAAGLWPTPPPWNWYYEVQGYVAGTDCARVGELATLYDAGGAAYTVLYADCAGDAATLDWMLKNRIVVELDAALFERLTAAHGRPLEVTLE